MSEDWLISYETPDGDDKVLYRYISAVGFDDAVREGKKAWAALCAAYERKVGYNVPSCKLLMVAYDPEHKIAGNGIRIEEDEDGDSET